jgi:hypothetical protein
VFKSDEELFADALEQTGMHQHRRVLTLSGCATAILALQLGDLSELSHEEVLMLARRIGFEFESHEEATLVTRTVQRFYELQEAHEDAIRQRPFASFGAHIFRDRHGRLMAQFSMGKTTFRPIPLEESWERKFALIHHDALAKALELGVDAYGVHNAKDGGRHDD